MHAATVEKSQRLQRTLAFLRDCGAAGATTREIVEGAHVMAVSAVVAELRANGCAVECKAERGPSGTRLYRYTLAAPTPELAPAWNENEAQAALVIHP